MTATLRSGTRTCSNCEETSEGAYVVTVGPDVLVLCEDCLTTLQHTLSRAARRRATRVAQAATLSL